MAIRKIKVNNIAVFDEIEIDCCDGINVIVGENGTGKTHLLRSIYTVMHYHLWNDESQWLSLDYTPNIAYPYEALKRRHEYRTSEDNSSMGVCYFDTAYANEPGLANLQFTIDFVYFTGSIKSRTKFKPHTWPPLDHKDIIFIPNKDMLTHSKGLIPMAKKYSKEMPFEKLLLDIIEKASQWKPDEMPELAKKTLQCLADIGREIGGTVLFENDEFFIQKSDGRKVSFLGEAEGFKKLGLLWQLLMNESITPGTILLWDEAEINLNPKQIPILVETLLELSRNGVQIFITTHDYNLMKYFSVKKKADDQVAFISLSKTESGAVISETEDDYNLLEHNSIVEANIKLLEDDIEGVL